MVSNIGDGWAQQFPKKWPKFIPQDDSPMLPPASFPIMLPGVSQAEFDALRKEVQELKALLEAAKKFDAATGQPDCEMDDKVKLIKAIAKMLGVDMGSVFEPPATTTQ